MSNWHQSGCDVSEERYMGCDCADEFAREFAAVNRDAERYRWLREHGAWESEAFLNGTSPAEFDAALDARIAND
jgi:hypothetical protein